MYTALEIRLMLKNTKLDIKEIARLMNFSNQSAMGKFFKTQVGMSPSEYRKSLGSYIRKSKNDFAYSSRSRTFK